MIFFNKKQKYKRTTIISKEEVPEEIKKIVKQHGFKISNSNKPDFVITYGGDGTILIAEKKYPGIPKLIIKNSDVCNQCPDNHPIHEKLTKVASNIIEIIKYDKLKATIYKNNKKQKPIICTNEINIRNQLLIQALRFRLYINDKEVIDEELIGDGVVISTPFGSKAYYKSITKKSFETGIGIALNNLTINKRGIHTTNDKIIKIEITRMTGDISYDNSTDIKFLEPGDYVIIKKSEEKLKIIKT